MNILVVNAGSSSLKYQLIDTETENVLAVGLCDSVGTPDTSFHKYEIGDQETKDQVPLPDHQAAIDEVLKVLVSGDNPPLGSLDEIDAVGHRIVQGGAYFSESVLIDEDVIEKVEIVKELAPLHNGPGILGIRACQNAMPGKPMVGVFDTAFHQTMPPKAYMYAIPYELYEKYSIRKYGFHGTSHRYVSQRAAEFLGKPIEDLKIVTCHLGNGASVAGVKGGKCIDTSMGLTPLDGLVMGTRSGTIDPAVIPFISQHEGISCDEVLNILNKKSGMLGVSGISNDLRAVEAAMDEGNERAKLAYDMFANSVKKYIGEYWAEMGGMDVIVFTAGVGENSATMRAMIMDGFEDLGIKIDPEENKKRGSDNEISTPDSTVKVLVIPTNEELMIARDTYEIVKDL